MTEYVHVPPPFSHHLTVSITSGLMPLEAPNQFTKPVAMLGKLGTDSFHRGFLIKVMICEQHGLPPVVEVGLLPQLASPPPRGDGHHLGFGYANLDKLLIVEGYDYRRHNGSHRSWSLANNLYRWRRWSARQVGEWGRRWSQEGSIVDKLEISRHWS